LGVQGALGAAALRINASIRRTGSDRLGTAIDSSPARADQRFWGSSLCDINNGRWRVDAICGSVIEGEARA